MSMTADVQSRRPDEASLDQKIRMVEQRLMRRRASSRLHLATFRWQLRDRMTSPLALLLATGIGFALGGSTKGSGSAQYAAAKAPPGAGGAQFLSTMLSMVSLAGSVMTLLQRFKADK